MQASPAALPSPRSDVAAIVIPGTNNSFALKRSASNLCAPCATRADLHNFAEVLVHRLTPAQIETMVHFHEDHLFHVETVIVVLDLAVTSTWLTNASSFRVSFAGG
jgi:hypothetical protein